MLSETIIYIYIYFLRNSYYTRYTRLLTTFSLFCRNRISALWVPELLTFEHRIMESIMVRRECSNFLQKNINYLFLFYLGREH
jgi:hypothetical protein